MKRNQENVKQFMVAAKQKINDKPSKIDKKDAELRVQLLLEEVLEFAEASGVEVRLNHQKTNSVIKSSDDLVLKGGGEQDLVAIADGLGDINYVSDGAALSYGIDMKPIEEEIQRSNMSKFIDGHEREDGKWVKGPSYSPANLEKIIAQQQSETQKVFGFST